jgi:transposase
MAYRPLVSDDLWEAIEPLLPRRAPQPKGGRPWVSDRAALGGIIFVLQTGIPWTRLPTELGYGSGITCWRRVREWQAAGVWERLQRVILNWLGDAGAIDWARASLDSTSVRANKGERPPGGTPPIAGSLAPSTT